MDRKNAAILRPRNWSNFQHYKDRSPPWIKLHRGLLDDFDYACLPLASKALAPLLWLLAAEQVDGCFTGDIGRLAHRLRWDDKSLRDGLTPLIDNGFFEIASGSLAPCLQGAIPEGEGEGESKEPKGSLSSAKAADPIPACPHEQIIALYHEILPANPAIKVWGEDRAKALRTRWREDSKRQSLDYWRKFFTHVAASPFLTGQRAGREGRAFTPGLDWLVKPANFAKIIENRYHEENT